ncbi:unnamed protein product, partial [Rotaria magnacalcarata]
KPGKGGGVPLTEQKLLEQYLYNISRLNSKLDCSSLPRCIADRFTYTFALEELCQSLKAVTEETEINPRQLLLPENPITEFYEDLFHCGLAMPSKISGWWLLNKIISRAAWCWKKIKSAASAVAPFCYSCVKCVTEALGTVVSAISDFVAPYAKQVGGFISKIAKPLLNTRIGKLAVTGMQPAKEAALDAGYATLSGAEWLVKKGGQSVNYVGKKATDLVNWIGDTRIVEGAVGIAKDFGSWIASTEIYESATEIATYIYRKMSNFVRHYQKVIIITINVEQ